MKKTAHLAVNLEPSSSSAGGGAASSSYAGEAHYDLDSDDENGCDRVALMAVRLPKPTVQSMTREREGEDSQAMDWTFPESHVTPEGGDRLFRLGTLKGKSFIDLTMEHPEQFLLSQKCRTNNKEMQEYVEWVS